MDELGSSPHDKLIFGKKVKIRYRVFTDTDKWDDVIFRIKFTKVIAFVKTFF